MDLYRCRKTNIKKIVTAESPNQSNAVLIPWDSLIRDDDNYSTRELVTHLEISDISAEMLQCRI